MKKVLKSLLVLALVVGATAAFAQVTTGNSGTGFFRVASDRFMKTFQNVRTMVLIFGGFGLVVLAVAAILGKVKWAALGALAAGLAIVAVAGKVVDYAVGANTESAQFASGTMDSNITTSSGTAPTPTPAN